jgi:BON domain
VGDASAAVVVVAVRPDRNGLLLAAMLGAAALGGSAAGPAQTAVTGPPEASASPPAESRIAEIVISAGRDQAVTAKVTRALQDDPHLYAGHITVVTENGVVRLQGIAFDVWDMQRMLYLARKTAGARRVVNEIELLVDVESHD